MKKLIMNTLGLIVFIAIGVFFGLVFASYCGTPAFWQIKRVQVNNQPAYYVEDYWDQNNPERCVIYLDQNLLLWRSNVVESKNQYFHNDLSENIRLNQPREQSWAKKIKHRMVEEGNL
ncbi:MAG: hypothetical protein PHH83_02770 [Patescibacteria group bacterium]|nr:hypothetical protein [Patescibacteria group bacterium]